MKEYSPAHLWRKLGEERRLTPEIREELEAVCGEGGRKALRAIDEGKVERFRDFLVVSGTTGRHVVEEEFCTCSAFLFRGNRCWHILAVRIAALSGGFRERDEWYIDIAGPGI
jgi:predicted nucleic acid-binding Zn finger protein